MIILELIVPVVGLYLIIDALRMKHSGEISKMVIKEDFAKHCKDKAGFVNCVYIREIVLGIIMILYGVIDYVNRNVVETNMILNIVNIVMVVGGYVWFSMQVNKARLKYFR